MATAQEIADAHVCVESCEDSDVWAIGADGEEIVIHDNGATED